MASRYQCDMTADHNVVAKVYINLKYINYGVNMCQ